jgi:hypothetical protein
MVFVLVGIFPWQLETNKRILQEKIIGKLSFILVFIFFRDE